MISHMIQLKIDSGFLEVNEEFKSDQFDAEDEILWIKEWWFKCIR